MSNRSYLRFVKWAQWIFSYSFYKELTIAYLLVQFNEEFSIPKIPGAFLAIQFAGEIESLQDPINFHGIINDHQTKIILFTFPTNIAFFDSLTSWAVHNDSYNIKKLCGDYSAHLP